MHAPTALGIDLGTSSIKLALTSSEGTLLADAERPLAVLQPFPGACEQNPDAWWSALDEEMVALAAKVPDAMKAVASIGLSGQMHGLVCLDREDRVLRPAILWNDNRARLEAREAAGLDGLEARAGLCPAPGLTACKLRWLDRHEPWLRERLARITFCKDYLRLRMTGEHATDPCEAAGSLLLDEAARDWSPETVAHFGLDSGMLPKVVEGPSPTGTLSAALTERWGIRARPVVIAGAGDGAAGGFGIGAFEPGTGFISIGTSAQITITQDHYHPAPGSTLQILAHGLPGLWYRAAALQSGAACLNWAAAVTGLGVPALLERVDPAAIGRRSPIFLPYLAGERTPHDNSDARGVLFGLLADHGPAEIGRAVLRGLAFALADGHGALARLGPMPSVLTIVGGGARSLLLCTLVASILDCRLRRVSTRSGAALGVARLALASQSGQDLREISPDREEADVIEPDGRLGEALRRDLEHYRELYLALVPSFAALEDQPNVR